MSPRYLSLIVVHWLLSTYLLSLAGSTIDDSTQHLATLGSLEILSVREVWVVPIPVPRFDYLEAIVGLLTWDYPWWRHGYLAIVRYLMLVPVSLVVGYFFITQVGPRLVSATAQMLQTTAGRFGLIGAGLGLAGIATAGALGG